MQIRSGQGVLTSGLACSRSSKGITEPFLLPLQVSGAWPARPGQLQALTMYLQVARGYIPTPSEGDRAPSQALGFPLLGRAQVPPQPISEPITEARGMECIG